MCCSECVLVSLELLLQIVDAMLLLFQLGGELSWIALEFFRYVFELHLRAIEHQLSLL